MSASKLSHVVGRTHFLWLNERTTLLSACWRRPSWVLETILVLDVLRRIICETAFNLWKSGGEVLGKDVTAYREIVNAY